MNLQEICFIERFLDRWSPDTKGEYILERLDKVDQKFKNVMLGVDGLCSKVKQNFPEMLK